MKCMCVCGLQCVCTYITCITDNYYRDHHYILHIPENAPEAI